MLNRTLHPSGKQKNLHHKNLWGHLKMVRFLRGELPLEGVSTEGLLQDAWLMAGHKSDDGFTYSTLTEKATKRVYITPVNYDSLSLRTFCPISIWET